MKSYNTFNYLSKKHLVFILLNFKEKIFLVEQLFVEDQLQPLNQNIQKVIRSTLLIKEVNPYKLSKFGWMEDAHK